VRGSEKSSFCAEMGIQTWKLTFSADAWIAYHWQPCIGSQGFIFQQDVAPAHMVRVTQDWLQANCPGFIDKNYWHQTLQILGPTVWNDVPTTVRSLSIQHTQTLSKWTKRYYTVSGKSAILFSTITLAFLVRFLYFSLLVIGMDTP